jgi:hypothetical protein
MSRQIYCIKCKKYLGEIRDAKLHKEINYICKKCLENEERFERFAKDDLKNQINKIFNPCL